MYQLHRHGKVTLTDKLVSVLDKHTTTYLEAEPIERRNILKDTVDRIINIIKQESRKLKEKQ